MKLSYSLFKVKKNKADVLKQHADFLYQRASEVLETLKEEQVLSEKFVLFQIGDEYYVLGETEFEKEVLPANMDREINIHHKKVKQECLEYLGSPELLYKFFSKD